MEKLFNTVPRNFFNYLSSGSNNDLYADCLKLISEQYADELSFRIRRDQVRDTIAMYLLERHIDKIDEDVEEGDYNNLASRIIRNLCAPEVGWLEEDTDENTFDRYIILTPQGTLLAEFLQKLRKSERSELKNYIFNIYNTLVNPDQWEEDPYASGLKNIYGEAQQLATALKRLSTDIRKIIEKLREEETLESLTENLIDYCDGSFIKEYARLTRQQNIYRYKNSICNALRTEFRNNTSRMEKLIAGCMAEEGLSKQDAEKRVLDMLDRTEDFFASGYEKIMWDIKNKMSSYLHLAIAKAKHMQGQGAGIQGLVERAISLMNDCFPDNEQSGDTDGQMPEMFSIVSNLAVDESSIRYPRKMRAIQEETSFELKELSEDTKQAALREQRRGLDSPYSRKNMKAYLNQVMSGRQSIESNSLPIANKQDMLSALAAAYYSPDNGYEVVPEEGYREVDNMIISNFKIRKVDA